MVRGQIALSSQEQLAKETMQQSWKKLGAPASTTLQVPEPDADAAAELEEDKA